MTLVLVGSPLRGQPSSPQQTTGDDPYHEFRLQPLEYVGPATEGPDLASLTEVAIGWFGPSDPDHALHGDLWVAANLAVEEANEAGGLHGLRVRLVPRWSENPWGTGVGQVARMVHEDRVWAILGSVDGPGTHLAEQVVAKARLSLVSPVSTDESVNLAGVPWMFSLAPGDHLWAPLMARGLLETIGDGYFVLLATTDHDSRLAAQELLEELATLERGPALRIDLQPGGTDLASSLQRFEESSSSAALVIASAPDSATLVRALRQAGFEGTILGGPQLGRRAFLESAGEAAEGVILPLLFDSEGDGCEAESFARTFQERTGARPDWAAAHTYDATRLLIESIRQSGLNRAAIRQAIVELTPWCGVTGIIEWDPTGQNHRPVTRLATIRGGRIESESVEPSSTTD
ncbi:MAG: ABC transporter substrate-binding protein [Thermoanaerobaculia bacterium]